MVPIFKSFSVVIYMTPYKNFQTIKPLISKNKSSSPFLLQLLENLLQLLF